MDRILDTINQQFEDSIGITDLEIEETKLSEEAVQGQDILPILPLKNIVTLPTSIVPVIVGRKSSIKAVEEALQRADKDCNVSILQICSSACFSRQRIQTEILHTPQILFSTKPRHSICGH